MFYDLAADTWGPEEKAAIQSVIDSGRLTMGPKVAEFEAAFAKYFGANAVAPHGRFAGSILLLSDESQGGLFMARRK